MRVWWLAQSENDVPASVDWLTPLERARLARMRFVKRRNDYLLGRWTAKRALAASPGLDQQRVQPHEIEIRNAIDGAPEAFVGGAPAAMTVAMTDRAGWGVCACTPMGERIGCDLELVEPRSAAFVGDYLTESERRLVDAAATDADRFLLANLIWSGKESALKVLRTGLRRDTRSVEVSVPLGLSPSDGWAPLRVRCEEGTRFAGWWRRFNDFVLTVATTRDCAPPTALFDLTNLHNARPTHSWMATFVVPDPPTPRTGSK